MKATSNSTVRAVFSAALPATRIRLAQFAALFAIASTFCGFAQAQVPEGSAVVGTFSGPRSTGTSGLFLIPLAGGAMTPVTGLPAVLQQTGGGPQQGVGSVGLRADGAIVVGTVAAATGPAQGDIELYLLYLNGSVVDPARTRQILLGTTTNTGGALVEPLPDGRILVFASNAGGALTTGPMANHLFAIVDVSKPAPTFTLLPNPQTGSEGGGGFAVDPTGQSLYYTLTTDIGSPSMVAYLYRWDLVTYQACVIASWPGQLARGLTCDDDGTVYVSANDGTTLVHYMHTVRPDGCNPAAMTTIPSSLSLVAQDISQDRASGRFVMATVGFAPGFPTTYFNSVWLINPATGAAALIASPTPGGWGVMGGVAVNNAIESYGAPSDGQNRYWFQNFPNPGGLPTVGNQAFSLTSRSAPGAPTLSVFALSTGRGSTQLFGAKILIDLNNSFLVTLPGATSTTIPLPIPNDPSLIGSVFTAQTAHFEGGPFALKASRGLTLTIR